uniref:hypothetical protein n=1 Tax=Chroococcidiopsis sp. TS-821 TaxID=1378066 RepID=UPI001AEF3EA9|nr:hypothetical protein [Chroococcidiopsis sp. TS-821]
MLATLRLHYDWQVVGISSVLEQLLTIAFGKAAVDVVAQEQDNRIVAWQNGITMAIKAAIARSPLFVERWHV